LIYVNLFLDLISNLLLKPYEIENIVLYNKNVSLGCLNYEHVLVLAVQISQHCYERFVRDDAAYDFVWLAFYKYGRFLNTVTVIASAVTTLKYF